MNETQQLVENIVYDLLCKSGEVTHGTAYELSREIVDAIWEHLKESS